MHREKESVWDVEVKGVMGNECSTGS